MPAAEPDDQTYIRLRGKAVKEPESLEAMRYAEWVYRLAPALYYAEKGKNKKVQPAEVEKMIVRLRDACRVYDVQSGKHSGDRDYKTRHVRAFYFLSIHEGTLGHVATSRRTLLRAAEVLGGWVKSPPGSEEARLAVQVCRSLGDSIEVNARGSSDHLRQMLVYTRRGLSLLRRFKFPGDIRQKALLLRCAGSAEARRRPHTARWLLRGERHLIEAVRLHEKHEVATGKPDSSTNKAYRELARVQRSLYRHFREQNPQKAGRYLDSSEQFIKKAIASGPKSGGESHWDHYHLAKVLRDRGDDDGALKECTTAIDAVESAFETLGRDENKVAYLTNKLPIYDLGVHVAFSKNLTERAYEFTQRAKARIFVGRLTQRLPERFPVESISDLSSLFDSKAGNADMGQGDALLEYHAGRHAVTIFVRTPAGLSVRRVVIPFDFMREQVDYVLGVIRDASIRGEGWWRSGLRDLAEKLIDPVEDLLVGAKRIIVVPSGPLSDVPFCALQLKDGRHAIERWGFSYLPHAALVRQKPEAAREGRFLAFADSQGDLFEAQLEASEVAKGFKNATVLSGPKALKSKLVELCSGARILHLACHGRYDIEGSRSPYIRLAGETQADWTLTVADILRLRLRGLDLAFLSGCHTARALQLGGDEMEGVHHAFLQAGARSVVACLWDIEDKATRSLVAGFYERLQAGVPKWVALRDTQLAFLRENPHPFYWAAFKLLGGK